MVKSSVLADWVRTLWMLLVIVTTASVKCGCFVGWRSKGVAANTAAFEGALGLVEGVLVNLGRSAADWLA